MSQNPHGKTIRLLTVPFTFVLHSQSNTFMFSKQFWIAVALFERSSPSIFPVFTKYIPAFYGDMIQKPPSIAAFNEWKTVTMFFMGLCRYTANCPRLRTHFTDILNSQLMYAVQLLMIKGRLTLILSFPKAWFLSRIRISNFRCFLHPASVRSLSFGLRLHEVIAPSVSKTASVAAEQRALLVFLARNRAFETSLREDL